MDPDKMTPEQLTALAGKLAPAMKQAMTEGIVSAVTDQLKQSLGETLTKQVAETVKAQVTEAMKTIQPAPEPKAGEKGKEKGEQRPIEAALLKLTERMDARDAQETKAKEEAAAAKSASDAQAATLKLATETLKAKRPNLKPEQITIIAADIAAAGPKDEAGVLATLGELTKTKYQPLGFDIKPLLADAGAEGAKPAPGTPEAKKEALREKIKSDAKAGAL